MLRLIIPLWLVLLVSLSLAPDDLKYHLGTKGPFHYAGHFIAFTLTGLLFCWTSSSFKLRLVHAVAACCVALCLEALESWFYGNRLEWIDVLVGCLGVALGFAIPAILQIVRTPAASYEDKT